MNELKYLLLKYPNKDWDFKCLTNNPNIDPEFIFAHPEFKWSSICYNPHATREQFMDGFRQIYNNGLALHDLFISYNDPWYHDNGRLTWLDLEEMIEMVKSYRQDYVAFVIWIGSKCDCLTLDIVKAHPEYPWNLADIYKNPKIPLDQVLKHLETRSDLYPGAIDSICSRDDVGLVELNAIFKKYYNHLLQVEDNNLTSITEKSFKKTLHIAKYFPKLRHCLRNYQYSCLATYEEICLLAQLGVKFRRDQFKNVTHQIIEETINNPDQNPFQYWDYTIFEGPKMSYQDLLKTIDDCRIRAESQLDRWYYFYRNPNLTAEEIEQQVESIFKWQALSTNKFFYNKNSLVYEQAFKEVKTAQPLLKQLIVCNDVVNIITSYLCI